MRPQVHCTPLMSSSSDLISEHCTSLQVSLSVWLLRERYTPEDHCSNLEGSHTLQVHSEDGHREGHLGEYRICLCGCVRGGRRRCQLRWYERAEEVGVVKSVVNIHTAETVLDSVQQE